MMWPFFVLIGIFSGLLAGLLGIGGGIIVVPSLFLLFHYLDLPNPHMMQIAVGTSLAAMTFTSFSSALFHHLSKRVIWDYFYLLAPGIILGAIVGALVADWVTSKTLGVIFGICLILVGAYTTIPDKPLFFDGKETPPVPSSTLLFFGFVIGLVSSLLGIGGGIITVPFLVYFHTPLKKAISTSAATGFLIALFGAISFLFFGMKEEVCPNCVGFIYPSAFIIIGITSSLTAPIGVKLVQILPTKVLKFIFGIALMATGLWIFFINK